MWELIIIISLAVIFFIFLRRMPEVERIGEEKLVKKEQKEKTLNFWEKIFSFFEGLRKKSKDLAKKEKQATSIEDLYTQAEQKMKLKDYVAAEKLFLRLVTLNPGEASNYASLGKVYSEQKNFSDAISSFKAAINRDKKNGFYYNDLAKVFFESGKYRESVLCYEKAILINNKIPTRHLGLGVALMRMGESEKAAKSFRRAIEIEPHNQHYRELYYKAKNKKETLKSLS